MDPLVLLRDFNLKGRLNEVTTQGDRVNFGGLYVFPLSTYTAFKSAQRTQDKAQEYYTLEVVLHALLNKHLSHPEYIKLANNTKTGAVAFTDRKKLLDFLDGKLDLQLEAPEGLPSALAAAPASAVRDQSDEPAAKRARLQEDESVFGVLAKQERQLRNRNTMLCAPNKDFSKVIDIATKALDKLKHHLGRQQQRLKAAQQERDKIKQQPKEQARPHVQQAIPIKPSNRLNREVLKDQVAAEAGAGGANVASMLDLYGVHGESAAQQEQRQQPDRAAPPPPPPPPPQPGSTGGITAPRSSSQGARPSAPKSGSSSGSKREHGAPGGKPGSSSAKPSRPVPAPAPAEKPKGIPIIIVPSGLTAMLNMYNAKQFLEQGRYESATAAQRAGAQKLPLLVITRTIGKPQNSGGVPYHVTDKAPDKGGDDWKRVVAVVAQGAKWQFKDWPFKGAAEGDLAETFSKVCGFFLHYSDEKVPDTVANWNVKRLGLHRENRHLDSTVLIDFYRHLDNFLNARRCALAF